MSNKQEVTEFDLRRPEFQDKRLTPEMFEFDATGDVVRKDRFERGIRKIHNMLCSEGILDSRDQWVTEDVVAAVKDVSNKLNRLKDLVLIAQSAPDTAEYFHFENRQYVREIDQKHLKAAREDNDHLVNFESCSIDGEWQEDSAWIALIDVLVSLDDIRKEVFQIIGYEEKGCPQPKCEHGFDVSCLLCGFGTIDGERVYHNT